MRYTITEIGDAILDALKNSEDLSDIRDIREYSGEVEEYLEGEGNVVPKMPAALVQWKEAEITEAPSVCSLQNEVAFGVVVFSGHLQGEAKRRRECREIVDSIITTLAGKRLSLDIEPIVPTGWEVIFTTKTVSAWRVSFKTVYDYDVEY